jgi:hypothetical protein
MKLICVILLWATVQIVTPHVTMPTLYVYAAQSASYHVDVAQRYVGLREYANNRGDVIDTWNKYVGSPVGSPYCAAFVSYCIGNGNVKEPRIRTGLATRFIIPARSIRAEFVLSGQRTVRDGSIVIWRKGNTMFGHVGFVEKQMQRNQFSTIEANTNSGDRGSQRDGNGVYRRVRVIQPFSVFRITHFTEVL